MEVAQVLAVYAAQLLAGAVVVLGFYRAEPLTWPSALARALLFGPGAVALQMQVYDFVGIGFSLPAVLGPWFALAPWLLFAGRHRFERARTRAVERGLLVLAGVLFLSALGRGVQTPIYSSDAVRNFAIHAKVYAEHRSLAPDALNAIRVGGHREYPPVVALNEALLFQAAADTRYAKPFFALAYLAFLLLVVEAVARRLRPAFAVPLGVLFLCLPQAAYAGGNAMADLPLTACFLLLGLELRSILAWPSAAGVLRIGLLAGLAASIKNEGLAVGALALIALGLWGLRGARLSRASLAGGAAIAVLLVAPWQAFKRAHGISERYLAHAVDQNPLENIDRVLPIARKFASVAFQPEQVGAPAPAFHGWLALAVLAYVALHRDRWRRTLPFLLALGVHVGLYAAVFLVTPRAFEWHIASASERLLLHTLPWLLLLCAAALGGPAAAPARPLRSQ